MLTVQLTLNNSDGNSVESVRTCPLSLPSGRAGTEATVDTLAIDSTVAVAVARLKAAALVNAKERA